MNLEQRACRGHLRSETEIRPARGCARSSPGRAHSQVCVMRPFSNLLQGVVGQLSESQATCFFRLVNPNKLTNASD